MEVDDRFVAQCDLKGALLPFDFDDLLGTLGLVDLLDGYQARIGLFFGENGGRTRSDTQSESDSEP